MATQVIRVKIATKETAAELRNIFAEITGKKIKVRVGVGSCKYNYHVSMQEMTKYDFDKIVHYALNNNYIDTFNRTFDSTPYMRVYELLVGVKGEWLTLKKVSA